MIVELKRYSPTYNLRESDLYDQVKQYRRALKKILLRNKGIEEPNMEIICVIGEDLDDWTGINDQKEANEAFASFDARIIRYDQLIEDSYSHYQEFIDNRKEKIGRIESIVDAVRDEMSESTDMSARSVETDESEAAN